MTSFKADLPIIIQVLLEQSLEILKKGGDPMIVDFIIIAIMVLQLVLQLLYLVNG